MEKEIDHQEVSAGDWRAVGGYLRQAIVETAHEVGGQEVVLDVISLAGDSSEIIPSSDAVRFLDLQNPGAAEAVLIRAKQIQEQRLKSQRRSVISYLFKRR